MGTSTAENTQNGTIIKSSTNCESATSSMAAARAPHARLPRPPSHAASTTNRTRPQFAAGRMVIIHIPDENNL